MKVRTIRNRLLELEHRIAALEHKLWGERDPIPKGNLDKLLHQIAARHNFTVSDLLARDNEAHAVAARRDFSKAARAQHYSYTMIARKLHRHHTTVLHLVKTKSPVFGGHK